MPVSEALDVLRSIEPRAPFVADARDAAVASIEDALRERKVELDPSWADYVPRCYVCGESPASWDDVLLLAGTYSGIEDDDPDHLIPIHRVGCLETR